MDSGTYLSCITLSRACAQGSAVVVMCDQEEIQLTNIGEEYVSALNSQPLLMLEGGTKAAVYLNRNRADDF